MSDTATAALDDRGQGGLAGFLAEATRHLLGPRMLAPALALLVILTASNIVILLNMPAEGGAPTLPFLAAAFVRLAGILVVGVAILRIVAPGERHPWLPDGAFWLYLLSAVAGFGIAWVIGLVVGSGDALAGIAIRNVLLALVLSPFAPWVVGMAVATPLGWNPARFMRDFGRWLPALLLWWLLLVTPLGIVHAAIDLHLIDGAGRWFWPLALFDGALSTIMALLGLGLNAEAYRRVARG